MAKKHRSPAYPSLTIGEALERAKQFYEMEKTNPSPVSVAVTHWGYGAKSSGGRTVISALKAYGLMDDEGSGANRLVSLTKEALNYLYDTREDSTERNIIVSEAVLKPKIIRDLTENFTDSHVSDGSLDFYLKQQGYNPNSVSDIIKIYRDAHNYLDNTVSEKEDNPPPPNVKIGDYIQWESQGVLRFPKPMKITSFVEDGSYLYVEGSDTGIPVSEVEVVNSPKEEHSPNKKPAFDQVSFGSDQKVRVQPVIGVGMKQENFTLNAGDIVIQFPSKMTQDDYDDFSDWLKILQRKIGRTIVPDEEIIKIEE